MAFKISEQARRDLVLIWRYIADENERAADKVLSVLYEHFALAGKSRFIGRRREDLLPGYRSFSAGRYVVLYRVLGNDVEITRVIHGRRDLKAALEE